MAAPSAWKRLDAVVAVTNVLLVAAALARCALPPVPGALVAAGLASRLACKHRAAQAMHARDRRFFAWHMAWHTTLPVLGALGVALAACGW